MQSWNWVAEFPKWLVYDDDNEEGDKKEVTTTLRLTDFIALAVGVGVAFANLQSGGDFTVNNVIAVCIASDILQLLSIGSGLLLYDVFWVFGSPSVFGESVMVAVATSDAFEGPIKLIFPSAMVNAKLRYSLLGLGDVAIPGLLAALLLRFDRWRHQQGYASSSTSRVDDDDTSASQSKLYFYTCFSSYVLGLVLTTVINKYTNAAQPALLYLVPATLCSTLALTLVRKETRLLFGYQDAKPETETDEVK
eukprot:jgi/Chlat1/3250/Chrsp22S00254